MPGGAWDPMPPPELPSLPPLDQPFPGAGLPATLTTPEPEETDMPTHLTAATATAQRVRAPAILSSHAPIAATVASPNEAPAPLYDAPTNTAARPEETDSSDWLMYGGIAIAAGVVGYLVYLKVRG